MLKLVMATECWRKGTASLSLRLGGQEKDKGWWIMFGINDLSFLQLFHIVS